jgi:[ribosomal protein S18]-alanine N-acetyltransferase
MRKRIIQGLLKQDFLLYLWNCFICINICSRRVRMRLFGRNMTREFAQEILTWRYEHPYDFYNNEPNEEGFNELMTKGYFAVVNEEGKLFGFYCIGEAAQVPAGRAAGAYDYDASDIGIGMKPEHTGKGKGRSFFQFVLEMIAKDHSGIPLRLTVAKFNKRAIKLYENNGFYTKSEFNSGATVFLTMVKG